MKNFSTKFDLRVAIAFFLFLLAGAATFIYQYFTHAGCDDIRYFVVANSYSVGSVIEFKDETPNIFSHEWNFGDDTPTDKRNNTFHQYRRPGTYKVSLVVNGTCRVEQIVKIDNAPLLDRTKIPLIIGPDAVEMGKPVRFNSQLINAQTWEWSFGESAGLDALRKSPVYTFKTTGVKKVVLIVNGDYDHVATKIVYVAPRQIRIAKETGLDSYNPEQAPEVFTLPMGAPQKDPVSDLVQHLPVAPPNGKDSLHAPPKIDPISEDQFTLLLLDVANQAKTKEDFAEYICHDYDLPVVKNGKTLVTFANLCKGIAGKKIRLSTLRLNRDKANCIKGITISYKIKKYMVWVND
ncbi:MAG TPA: PKD domain-containing protein [Chryseolinea sp.]